MNDAIATIALDGEAALFVTREVADIDNDGFDDVIIGHLGFATILYGQGR